MGDLVKAGSGGLAGLLHGGDIPAVPAPFERDIFLFGTYVAGTTHITGIMELEPHLNVGDRLTFLREPDNPHDSYAIRINNADGVKLGYVPRADNPVFARLMDAGKLLFGRITSKEITGNWLKLGLSVFLHE